jgi:cytochrome c oxidase assembly factor CtaG
VLALVAGAAPGETRGHAPGLAHDAGDPVLALLTLDPWTLVPLALLVAGFVAGWLRRGGRAIARWRAGSLAAAVAVLAVAMVWPLDALGEVLFSAHMAQHMLLLAVAPPLIALARPGPVVALALPRAWRTAAARPWRGAAMRRLRALGRSPGIAGLVQAVVLWFWHLPAAFDLALRDDAVHRLEHLSFFAAGMLFWRAIVAARHADEGRAVLALFVTVLHSGMLGALLTFAPRLLYASYANGAGAIDPLVDQQLAGMLMWVPMAAVYVVAAMWLVRHRLSRGSAAVAS